MKLLQSEVDVVPGRKPQKQPLPEGFVGTGVATLRLINTTPRQNSYTIKLKCEDAYWQDAWYTVAALPPAGGPENAPPSGKPDQAGPRNQSLTVFIKDGGARDVLLSFFVPEKSECRAGVYRAKVIVETRIVSDDPQLARQERITEIPVSIIVRPFYKWQVNFSPEIRRVGILRRGSSYELAIDNQGNDWLYCDLKLPRPQNVLVDTPVSRIAIPPPEPGGDSVRTVPIRAISRLKMIRGSHTPTPLPLQIQRLDAPTVPPLPEEATYGPSSANLGAAVTANDTNETGVPETPAKLVYCPPIPDTFTAFIEAIVRNAKGFFFAIVGAFVAFQVAVYAYELYFKNIMEVRVTRSSVKIGEPFRIRGKNLIGAQILLFDPVTKQQLGEPITPKVESHGTLEYVVATITDKDLDGKKVIVGAQRLGTLTILGRFLPVTKDPTSVQIGKAPDKPKGAPSGTIPASVDMNGTLTIGGQNFGDQQGRVLINGKPAKVVSWADETVQVKVPNTIVPGDSFSVAAYSADNQVVTLNPNICMVKDVSMPPDETTDGSTGSIPDTTGSTSGGSGGTSGGGSGGTTGATGGGSGTSGSTSGGGTRPTGSTGALPTSSYQLLLSDNRADYVKAANNTRSAKDPGSLAVRAYALAALNRVDEARTAINKATQAMGDRDSGNDVALCMLAFSKAIENANPANAVAGYAQADGEVDKVAPGFVFKDIVIARFKMSQNSKFEAKVILQDALKKGPTAAERTAINRMLKQVGG
ncbi:MAG: hypothetical protein BGO01_02320 [Armatimonadetes bacterium 55-13]|nr:hypothetical protein [Armatimonadota bacterium]OJU65763.1 MAG: hypothetical protein BGO01_02320 [Armatimonadetes bacterium 55-13]